MIRHLLSEDNGKGTNDLEQQSHYGNTFMSPGNIFLKCTPTEKSAKPPGSQTEKG